MALDNEVLEGYVEYRFNLATILLAADDSRKKQKGDNGIFLRETTDKEKAENSNKPSLPETGYYLVVTNSALHQDRTYLLSIPRALAREVCDVARFGGTVRISRYTSIPIAPIWSEESRKRPLPDSSTLCSPHGSHCTTLLEIHDSGLEVLSITEHPETAMLQEDFWTLEQVYNAESQVSRKDTSVKSQQDLKISRSERRSNRYSFRGTVDSISPVIFLDEPFAMMEVYQPNPENSVVPYSCVVVFQGVASLTCHAGITPGDKICLKRCKRQRWKIPDVLTKFKTWHLRRRIPSHVFVLQDPKDIVWTSTVVGARPIPQTISTTIPLVSILGKVTVREWASRGNLTEEESYSLHTIELEPLVTDNKEQTTTRYILFLTYFPMSPALTLSIRRGATVLAVNVHCLGISPHLQRQQTSQGSSNATINSMDTSRLYYYGACLRSTIAIVQMPPSNTLIESPQTTHYVFNDLMSLSKYYPTRPHAFVSIQRSYGEYACRKHVYRTFYAHDTDSKRCYDSELPALDAFCKSWWQNPNDNNLQKPQEPFKRNPYLEFLDHACDNEGCDDIKESQQDSNMLPASGCQCSHHASLLEEEEEDGHHQFTLPSWLPLHELRDKGILIMQERITRELQDRKECELMPHVGWTATIDLRSSDYLEDSRGINPPFYGGGRITATNVDIASSSNILLSPTTLANDFCIIPANPMQESPIQDVQARHNVDVSFAFGELDGVIVTCFCVGKVKPSATRNTKLKTGKAHIMIPYDHDAKQGRIRGACSLWETCGFLFIISVQLRFKSLIPVQVDMNTNQGAALDLPQAAVEASTYCGGRNVTSFFTIEQCLDPVSSTISQHSDNVHAAVVGALTRQRFRPLRFAINAYRGCVLTLHHIPIRVKHDPHSVSTLQCIEVKTEMCFTDLNRKRMYLREQFALLECTPIGDKKDDAINLLLAWWKVADNPTICPLSCGGWDDVVPTKASPDYVIAVQLPGSAIQKVEPRGYQRFMCHLSKIKCCFLRIPPSSNSVPRQTHPLILQRRTRPYSKVFDFVGGFKILPGKLDRRPLRQFCQEDLVYLSNEQKREATFSSSVGEQLEISSSSLFGVPSCSLEHLIRCVCLELKQQRQSKRQHLAPSLVRKVEGAQFLGISFCQAQVTCTRCFQTLRQTSASVNCTTKRMDGDELQPSYWHCPLPIARTTSTAMTKAGANDKKDTVTQTKRSSRKSAKSLSKLYCPNGCDVDRCGEVKWECSGTLDDGTAQAKLYAEREAAIMLLGMSQEKIDWIEEGAWMHPNGCIAFSRTIPPPNHLAKAVESANFRYTARRNEIGKLDKRHLLAANKVCVLDMLEPVDRAMYVLYNHCRHSLQATRHMDYFVRCKPLADTCHHLNFTEIERVSPGARKGTISKQYSATYSLPPLKLVLVDACVPRAASSGDAVVEATWDLLECQKRDR